MVIGLGLALAASAGAAVEGAPLTRFYPLEEIGCSSRGLQLLHDSFGRIAVAQQGEFFVLNDSIWQETWRDSVSGLGFRRVVSGLEGETYYGAFGSWGTFKTREDGVLQPVSLTPAEVPPWVRSCNFVGILCAKAGVFFYGLDGVVFRPRGKDTSRFFAIRGVSCMCPLGDKVIVATYDDGMMELDPETGRLAPAALGLSDRSVVVAAAGDGCDDLLLATTGHRLLVLREGRIVPASQFPGAITALVRLAEGGFAASIAGYGVVLLDHDGTIRRTFGGADFRGVGALESREPGVLWAATERGVLKILYGQPFTTFGRDQGLPINWPQVAWWHGRPIVASGGRIFEPAPSTGSGDGGFRTLSGQPSNGGWGLSSLAGSLLIGNGDGVFRMSAEGGCSQVLSGVHVARLVALDDVTCLAIGMDAISALRWDGTAWGECVPRIAGIGYPYVVHMGNGGAWLELGLNRVARISLEAGQLQVRLLEEFAWREPSWVNVSIVGSTVVLCGSGPAAMFLDERTGRAVDAPELRDLFERSPYPIQRLARDGRGDMWVSHDRGLFLARRRDSGYELDLASYAGINEPTPLARCAAEGENWASTGSSLYRLQDRPERPAAPASGPVLVALQDTRTGTPLMPVPAVPSAPGRLRYAQNSLQLDFFAGSYAMVRPFWYEYRLNAGAWQRANAGSSVFLADLHEGAYALEVRTADNLGPVGVPAGLRFGVEPPWYRRWYSYGCYPLLALVLGYSVFRYASHRHRVRVADLERQVGERTAELRAAMDRLQVETETSATLAERTRLAAEIHDSLEQGFTGVALQVETTAGLPGCPEAVRAGLRVALSMVAYCRKEVRHVIDGLRSPILDAVDLPRALQLVVAQTVVPPCTATVRIEGQPRGLGPTVEHHLLRIAQEALANASKHAAARSLEVELRFATEGVRLVVRDDGRGFSPADAAGCPGHLGLASLRNRAANMGGTAEIISRPGGGTTVHVSVPGNEKEKI